MKIQQLTRTLARQSQLPAAEARDEVEELVHRIVTRLRQGQSVDLPGVGKLKPAKKPLGSGRQP